MVGIGEDENGDAVGGYVHLERELGSAARLKCSWPFRQDKLDNLYHFQKPRVQ